MLRATGLAKAFGSVHAVKGVSIETNTGRALGVLGPNGAGKSTTLRMLVGLLWPDRGSVNISGHDVFKAPERARALLGYLPESGAVYTEMNPEAYLRFRCALFGIRRPKSLIDRALDLCRLQDVRKCSIATLSKGLTQRVALAGSIVHDPPVLILDEPTNGLDVSQLREARGVLRDLAAEKTLLISSHLLGEIEHIADDIAIIAGGTLVASGKIDEVKNRSGRANLIVESAASPEQATALLPESVSATTTEPLEDGLTRIIADLPESEPSESLRREIGRRAQQAGIALARLEIRRPSLEDAFVGIVSEPPTGEQP